MDVVFICGKSINISTKAINDHYELPTLSRVENEFCEFYEQKNLEAVHDRLSDGKTEVERLEHKNLMMMKDCHKMA